MVHRPADSRLLTNLLQQEKEYSKQLNQVLESSNASLASFAAYAAASPPPVSHVILEIAGSLAAADEALRRYLHGVEEWREAMRMLKGMEDEVGNIMRDREILVTRLIKASKSQKSSSGNIRESLLLGHQRFPSSSSLSLSGQQESPSPSPSRPLSSSFSSSTKLAAAQSELQACEAHLAAKERELEAKRGAAVRDGLGSRARAMAECGWAWGELGKEALRTLEGLGMEQHAGKYESYLGVPTSPNSNGQAFPVTEPEYTRPSYDFSSIGPSQSASQTNDEIQIPPAINVMNPGLFSTLAEPETKPTVSTSARPPSGTSTTGSSMYYTPATATTYKTETVTYAPAVAMHVPARNTNGAVSPFAPVTDEVHRDESLHRTVHLPAPHALKGYAYEIPMADSGPIAGPSGEQQRHSQSYSPTKGLNEPSGSGSEYSTPQWAPLGMGSGYATPQADDFQRRHVLERRITEEELRRSSMILQDEDASSEDEVKEEKKLVQEGKLAVVENPRFMTEARKRELEREREKAEKEDAERRRMEKGKEKEGLEDEHIQQDKEPLKERRHFSFLPHHHRRAESQSTQKSDARHGSHVTFAAAVAGSPSKERGSPPKPTGPGSPSKSANSSPSKGFLGSLRGLFGVKQPNFQEKEKEASPRLGVAHDSDLTSDEDEESSPRKGGGAGLQGLFRSGGSKKNAAGVSTKWETRTDKNIRELSRRGSFDGGVGRVGVGVAGIGVGGGAVLRSGFVAADVGNGSAVRGGIGRGKGQPRVRAASDVGVGRPSAATAPSGPPPGARGRKLKKNRAVGPPVAPSAADAARPSFPARPTAAQTTPASAPQGRTPGGAAAAAASKVSGRRSASVDVALENRRSVIEQEAEEEEEENGGVSVGLGKRRRATSEVGGSRAAAPTATGQRTVPGPVPPSPAIGTMPFGSPVPARASKAPPPRQGVSSQGPIAVKEYSSDTAVLAPSAPPIKRKKSLTKRKAQDAAPTASAVPTAIPVPTAPSLTSMPAPTRRASSTSSLRAGKSSTTTPVGTPSKRPTSHHSIPSTGGSATATVLPAGGVNPSGILVSQRGWGVHDQAPGGGLSRNSSIVSAASAPTGGLGLGRGKKQTALGQGMGSPGGLVRRSSMGSSGSGQQPKTGATSGTGTGTGAVVQPAPVPSLMSIVADVARGNREGWNQDLKKSVGGSQKPSGMIEIVRAPPSVGRKELAALDSLEIKSRVGTIPSEAAGGGSAAGNAKATGLFEIKAPGSVFDDRYRQQRTAPGPLAMSRVAAASTPELFSLQKQRKTQPSSSARLVVRKASASIGTPSGSGIGTGQRSAKTPLRSALRNPSRTPSPQVPAHSALPQQRDGQTGLNPRAISPLQDLNSLPPPLVGMLPWGADGTLQRQLLPQQQQQQPNREDKGKGKVPAPPESVESANDSTSGTEVFYSDEEEFERVAGAGGAPTASKPVANDHAPANGHAAGYGSELSESTASTAVTMVAQPGQGQETTPFQTARRRKSVRVSLQPTFSPSPPAIEYDESEARQHIPWVWKPEHKEEKHLPAPIALPAARQSTIANATITDIWADSSDEDTDYERAKRLLKRAAKKEKDVTLLVANRA